LISRQSQQRTPIGAPEPQNAGHLALHPLMTDPRQAFDAARDDPAVGVVILTGQGPEAFCSGGDQKIRGDDGYRDDHGIGRLNVLDLQVQIRRLPKPVIAMVVKTAWFIGALSLLLPTALCQRRRAVFGFPDLVKLLKIAAHVKIHWNGYVGISPWLKPPLQKCFCG